MARGRPRSTSLPYLPADPHIESDERTDFLMEQLSSHTEVPYTLLSIIPRRLREWAAREFPDGVLGRLSPRTVNRKIAVEFSVPPDTLMETLINETFGFLIREPDGTLKIAEWDETGGRVLKARERWRKYNNNAPHYHVVNSRITPSESVDNSELSTDYPRDTAALSRSSRNLKVEGKAYILLEKNQGFPPQASRGDEVPQPAKEPTPPDAEFDAAWGAVVVDDAPMGLEQIRTHLQNQWGNRKAWGAEDERIVQRLCPIARSKVDEIAGEVRRKIGAGMDPTFFRKVAATRLQQPIDAPPALRKHGGLTKKEQALAAQLQDLAMRRADS